MTYIVRDGVRKLKLEGDLLAHSSSRIPGRPRWVEFTMYKTQRGTYVIYRVGQSRVFHRATCDTVNRNKLSAVDGLELERDFVPCRDCLPSRTDMDGVYPESARHFVQSSDNAKAVIGSLMRYDDFDTPYLTNVARELLEAAAELDAGIADAFYSDTIE